MPPLSQALASPAFRITIGTFVGILIEQNMDDVPDVKATAVGLLAKVVISETNFALYIELGGSCVHRTD